MCKSFLSLFFPFLYTLADAELHCWTHLREAQQVLAWQKPHTKKHEVNESRKKSFHSENLSLLCTLIVPLCFSVGGSHCEAIKTFCTRDDSEGKIFGLREKVFILQSSESGGISSWEVSWSMKMKMNQWKCMKWQEKPLSLCSSVGYGSAVVSKQENFSLRTAGKNSLRLLGNSEHFCLCGKSCLLSCHLHRRHRPDNSITRTRNSNKRGEETWRLREKTTQQKNVNTQNRERDENLENPKSFATQQTNNFFSCLR